MTSDSYSELLAIQAKHLTIWESRLRPELFSAISSYVLSTNRESGDRPTVYRGQDLIEIIRLWPDVGPTYPPLRATAPDEGVL